MLGKIKTGTWNLRGTPEQLLGEQGISIPALQAAYMWNAIWSEMLSQKHSPKLSYYQWVVEART